MSRTVIMVLYVRGEEMMNNCDLDWNALDDMMDKRLYVPVKHGKEIIGTCIGLSKKGDRILATVELIGEIAYNIQQKGKRSVGDMVTITDAELHEIYI